MRMGVPWRRCEHLHARQGATHDVSNGVDAGHVGREVVVDLHLPTLVHLDADLVQPEAHGVRHTTRRDENDVGIKGLRLVTRHRIEVQPRAASGEHLGRVDLGLQLELHPLLFEDALHRLCHLFVHRSTYRCNGRDGTRDG